MACEGGGSGFPGGIDHGSLERVSRGLSAPQNELESGIEPIALVDRDFDQRLRLDGEETET